MSNFETELRFPDDFLFGTATSATQVEGGCAGTDWSEFSRQPGRVYGGATPDVACDEWNRWPADVALQRSLGLNAYRLSLEWARVEPRPGEFDHAVLDHYRSMLGALVDNGIEPLVTLHHFSLPVWQARAGGLLDRELPDLLTRYARQVVSAVGDLCRRWITINEPNVVATNGFDFGVWPPGEHSLLKAIRAQHNLLAAHVDIFRAIHDQAGDSASVGVAHHLRVFEPARPGNPADRAGSALIRWGFNDAFARALCEGTIYGFYDASLAARAKGTQDFFGLNYYTRDLVRFNPMRPGDVFLPRGVKPGAEINDLGWEVYPEGLGRLIREWAGRSGVPILITENGVADASDRQRPSFLVRHLAEVARARAEGIDVAGYFHWSLIDNFEWAEGYRARFGLVDVDFATQARSPRPSAALYRKIATARVIDAETWRLHGTPPPDVARERGG